MSFNLIILVSIPLIFIVFSISSTFPEFLEAFFIASSHVLVAVSNSCFPYLLDRFLVNGKNPYLLTYFPVLGSME